MISRRGEIFPIDENVILILKGLEMNLSKYCPPFAPFYFTALSTMNAFLTASKYRGSGLKIAIDLVVVVVTVVDILFLLLKLLSNSFAFVTCFLMHKIHFSN